MSRKPSTTVRRHREVHRAAHLYVLLECTRPLAGGARHSLEGVNEVSLGRGRSRGFTRARAAEGATLSVTVPDRTMSTEHARLTLGPSGWVFEDQRSRNGSFLNGSAAHLATLRDGDVLQLGHTLFVYREALITPEETPADVDAKSLADIPLGLASLVPREEHHLAKLRAESATSRPLLLVGEPGAAAELLARGLHARSRRAGPFVSVLSGALTASRRLDGEGAADADTTAAPLGGTLFLDEIEDLPLREQDALLRLIRENEASAGSGVRVVVGSASTPAKLATHGALSRELLAALAPGTHALRPLRARGEDLGLFVAHVVGPALPSPDHPIAFTTEAAMALLRYAWPLHVQELVSCLQAAVILCGAQRISREHLPEAVIAALAASAEDSAGSGPQQLEATAD
jgi:pSer/pThr/pTyr-binding forkhead associated (FHA) protein